MPLTFQRLRDYAHLHLGEQNDPRLDAGEIVNEAGRYLVSMHSWRFLERPRATLNLKGPISLTDATWTESSKTLTKASAFSDYTFQKGDRIQITDGTGATAGYYNVAGKTSANAITLEATIGAGADGETDIDATLYFPYVDLPTDFDQLVKVESATSYSRQLILTSASFIETLRGDVTEATLDYYVALEYPAQASSTENAPRARLCLYPTATADASNALTVVYRAGWTELSTLSQVPNIPTSFEALLVELVEAIAKARAKSESITERVEPIERGGMLKRLKEHDGTAQPHAGMLRNGCVRERLWSPGVARRYHDTITY